jgi:hypothetical protein
MAMQKEVETVSINCDLPEFLTGLSMAVPVLVFVNARESFRGSQSVCGQLWTQEGRQMSASNVVLEDIATSRKFV